MPQLSAWSGPAPFRLIMSALGVAGPEVTFQFSPDGIIVGSTDMRACIDSSYFDHYASTADVSIKLHSTDVVNFTENWRDGEIITLQLDAAGTRLVCKYETEDLTYVLEMIFFPA